MNNRETIEELTERFERALSVARADAQAQGNRYAPFQWRGLWSVVDAWTDAVVEGPMAFEDAEGRARELSKLQIEQSQKDSVKLT